MTQTDGGVPLTAEQVNARVALVRDSMDARREALDVLAADASVARLNEVATRVAYTLRRAVDDEQLWQDLDGARRTGPLTPGRRAALALMVGLDYGPLLDVAGYRPPPPAALLSADLNQAASE